MKDQLSAWIDGEIALDDAQHLITAAKNDSELKSAWQDYHLIGDAMRGELHTHTALADKIMLALQDEPTVLSPNATQVTNRGESATKTWALPRAWSMAASVAAVMFVGVMVWQNQAAQADSNAPVQIAEEMPMEYLAAHQAAAPTSVAYYIQPAVYEAQK